jgi:DNA-directed RNA polymerase subunit N (RpoN/RPB10)
MYLNTQTKEKIMNFNFIAYKEEWDVAVEDETINNAIGNLLEKANQMIKCVGCGKVHDDVYEVWMYDHSSGWKVEGLEDRQWLSVACDCGYHTSLNKLGINRYQG